MAIKLYYECKDNITISCELVRPKKECCTFANFAIACVKIPQKQHPRHTDGKQERTLMAVTAQSGWLHTDLYLGNELSLTGSGTAFQGLFCVHSLQTVSLVIEQKVGCTHKKRPRCRGPPTSEIKGFTPISEEQEVCPMAEEKKYYIYVPEASVEVTEEVYRAYYQEDRYGRTVEEKDRRNGLTSYDELDTAELTGQEMIPDRAAISVEDAAIDRVMRDKLRRCLPLLDESEEQLICAIFYEGLSERECAEILGISQNAVNKRRKKVLAKLRRLIGA